MKSKKTFFSFLQNNKKKVTALAALMLCLGAYAVTGGMMQEERANEDIPLHDGDVLVDSLNVEESPQEGESQPEGAVDESALVASDDVVDPENTDAYFQELRATLDMDRNKIIAMLTEAESTASTQEEKKKASEEKMALLGYMEQEKTIEALIKNKGLPETFVVVTDSGINVTVNTEDLDQAAVTKICEIVMRQTGRSATEIVVQDVS